MEDGRKMILVVTVRWSYSVAIGVLMVMLLLWGVRSRRMRMLIVSRMGVLRRREARVGVVGMRIARVWLMMMVLLLLLLLRRSGVTSLIVEGVMRCCTVLRAMESSVITLIFGLDLRLGRGC